MRILEVLEPSGGGSGRHFIDLCQGLKARGHSVVAVYSPVRAEERFVRELAALNLGNVIALPMLRAVGPKDLGAWITLSRVIHDQGPFDIIHGHSSKAGALTRLRLPGPHVPRIYTPHAFRTMDPNLSSKGRILFGAIEGFLGRFLTDRLICVSQNEYDHALSLGIPARKLEVVVNGVPAMPTGQRSAIRDRFGLPQDALVFGFIGRLSAQKAPERLISAFATIAREMPQAHLLIIGSGELETDVRQQIGAAGIADRVVIDADLPGAEALQAFDALVMTSRYEAMSYVMLEAATAGLPLILTDVGGTSNVLDHEVNGIVVPNADDTAPLAAAMRRLGDGPTRARFADAARQRSGRYSVDTMVEQTLDIYRRSIVG
ncbi:glycosyl transferase [Ciceribacter naphthalenivorans]|uniref:Glycosyl transferase n=2 Tax=Alphaproteobacteria TaxID=28211 RepID=A0A512HGQ7_9HYPH|nr:glycosyl transferase [Ciceribacter naphthalenivorans]GLR22589.1 glycosyl transferase [Ciceribacter naphthalenivorans]GLT05445.1 glycosyl transferase [Sphingomonas psychrolutea]